MWEDLGCCTLGDEALGSRGGNCILSTICSEVSQRVWGGLTQGLIWPRKPEQTRPSGNWAPRTPIPLVLVGVQVIYPLLSSRSSWWQARSGSSAACPTQVVHTFLAVLTTRPSLGCQGCHCQGCLCQVQNPQLCWPRSLSSLSPLPLLGQALG